MFSFRCRAISVIIAIIATQLGDFIKISSLSFPGVFFINALALLPRENATTVPIEESRVLSYLGENQHLPAA
jgi:hypothetical protein